MRKLLLLNLVFLAGCCTHTAEARLVRADDGSPNFVRIAVIDTGIDPELLNDKEYCREGHRDFTIEVPELSATPTKKEILDRDQKLYEQSHPNDEQGHGTHISGIIDQYAKNFILVSDGNPKDLKNKPASYCQIILKYYKPDDDMSNLKRSNMAFRWAIDHHVDIINYSAGGVKPSPEEKALIIEALDKGIKVVAAAGNERSDIDKHPYYPASYDPRIYVVGHLVNTISRSIAGTSNYGKGVTSWERGTDILSRLPHGMFGYMSGTSQAAAMKSGKLVRQMMHTK